jgi:hypothetical protein
MCCIDNVILGTHAFTLNWLCCCEINNFDELQNTFDTHTQYKWRSTRWSKGWMQLSTCIFVDLHTHLLVPNCVLVAAWLFLCDWNELNRSSCMIYAFGNRVVFIISTQSVHLISVTCASRCVYSYTFNHMCEVKNVCTICL